mgnify:CR=1 FL=1
MHDDLALDLLGLGVPVVGGELLVGEQVEQDQAETEGVALVLVLRLPVGLALNAQHELGRHEGDRALDRLRVLGLNRPAAQVRQLHLKRQNPHDDDVLRLDVPVRDPVRLKPLQHVCHLKKNPENHSFGEDLPRFLFLAPICNNSTIFFFSYFSRLVIPCSMRT